MKTIEPSRFDNLKEVREASGELKRHFCRICWKRVKGEPNRVYIDLRVSGQWLGTDTVCEECQKLAEIDDNGRPIYTFDFTKSEISELRDENLDG